MTAWDAAMFPAGPLKVTCRTRRIPLSGVFVKRNRLGTRTIQGNEIARGKDFFLAR
jgi:hypothetical protein